jgi:hypothetical protein
LECVIAHNELFFFFQPSDFPTEEHSLDFFIIKRRHISHAHE